MYLVALRQVCLQASLGAPFMPYQNMQGMTMAPVSPGLQPMVGSNPTLLQSRPPKKEKEKEEKRGRAPCPIGVYVDLSSLRLREKGSEKGPDKGPEKLAEKGVEK